MRQACGAWARTPTIPATHTHQRPMAHPPCPLPPVPAPTRLVVHAKPCLGLDVLLVELACEGALHLQGCSGCVHGERAAVRGGLWRCMHVALQSRVSRLLARPHALPQQGSQHLLRRSTAATHLRVYLLHRVLPPPALGLELGHVWRVGRYAAMGMQWQRHAADAPDNDTQP